MSTIILRKYGQAAVVPFELFEVDGINFRKDAVYTAGDIRISINEGAEANTTNGFVDTGTGYSLALTAVEMQGARISIYLVDQDGTKVWLDKKISIETYGDPLAEHEFDLDSPASAGGGPTAVEIREEIDTGSVMLSAISGYIDTEIAAIKLVTDALPDGGSLTGIATHLTDIKGASFAGATDSLEALRDRGDTAWITGSGGVGISAADVWAHAARTLTSGANLGIPSAVDNRTEFDSNSIQISAIKAKTDSLTFTNPGELNINVKSLNDRQITGNGTTIPFDVT